MKYSIKFTSQLKKDFKLAKKQGENLNKLFEVLDTLTNCNLYSLRQALSNQPQHH